ncbi:MAG: helix-turn-helix domain-containing protein [Roseivirga sp.]|nr:helix-turn-helix domain-containing protein [Roseivirga sp.]
MERGTMNLGDIKRLRVERHWSQEQLAEMSGLSVRTIQRIENGDNAGMESLKALASVFEVDLSASDKAREVEQARKEEAYVQSLKGLYKLMAVAVFSLLFPFITGLQNSDWGAFGWMLLSWVIILGAYSINSFDLFGERWRQRVIKKKFGND